MDILITLSKALIKDIIGTICLLSLFFICVDSTSVGMQILWTIGCLTISGCTGLLFGKLESMGW